MLIQGLFFNQKEELHKRTDLHYQHVLSLHYLKIGLNSGVAVVGRGKSKWGMRRPGEKALRAHQRTLLPT